MTGIAVRERANRNPKGSTRWMAAGIALLVVLSIVPLLVNSGGAAAAARKTTVKITTGPLGRVLVNANGRALYVDAHDRVGHLDCTGGCTRAWPPVLLARGVKRATAGPGVRDLGTVLRPDHRLQVTSHKMPLYLYVGDGRPGQFQGQGLLGSFFVATPSGRIRMAPAAVAPPTTVLPANGGQPMGRPATTPAPGTSSASSGGISGGAPSSTSPAPAMPAPGPTGPPTSTPPVMRPPVTSPPVTSPPVTSPPATSPPTTAPVGGGVAY